MALYRKRLLNLGIHSHAFWTPQSKGVFLVLTLPKRSTCPNSVPLCLPSHGPLLVLLQPFSLAFLNFFACAYSLNVNFSLGFLISPSFWTTTITSIQVTTKSDLPLWPFCRSKYQTAQIFIQGNRQILQMQRIPDRTCSLQSHSWVICYSRPSGQKFWLLTLNQGHFQLDTKFCVLYLMMLLKSDLFFLPPLPPLRQCWAISAGCGYSPW